MKKFQIGICSMSPLELGGGSKDLLALAEHLAQRHSVTLMSDHCIDWQQRQHFFKVDLSRVNLVYLRPLPQQVKAWLQHQSPWEKRLERQFILQYYIQQIRRLHLDLFINSDSHADLILPPIARHSLYLCAFPSWRPKQQAGDQQAGDNALAFSKQPCIRAALQQGKLWLQRFIGTSIPHAIARYDVVTANSKYTQAWIQHYWGRSATVVYTASELVSTRSVPLPKEKIICHAGRFVADPGEWSAWKRQDLLIETFKALPDLHQTGWQLHLAGGFSGNAQDAHYLAEIRQAAEGYPIHFHVNAPVEELHNLYRRASLYWHATGYGRDAERYPITQEHFGITTVEAMSAGAVPVVIDTAGQKETVEHGVSGFRWDQLAELAAYTRQLAADPNLWQAMSQQAMQRSQQFGKAQFLARLDVIIERLLALPPNH